MAKLVTILSFTMGLLVAAIAFAGGFASGPVQAREQTAAQQCRKVPVRLDEGYGVSRMALRSVCSPTK